MGDPSRALMALPAPAWASAFDAMNRLELRAGATTPGDA